jgi:predicted esterase
MRPHLSVRFLLPLLSLAWWLPPSPARGEDAPEDEFKDLPHEERKAGDDAKKRWFLIGPREKAEAPKEGFPLLVVLPGGDGGDGFLPFVKRIHLNALPKEWLVAQPVALKWKPAQQVVWPHDGLKVPGMEFTTEEFIEAVVTDAAKAKKVDPARVYALGWSSSGPALYAHSLSKKRSVVGWYIAMSVFHPKELPALTAAKGLPYRLDHSPEDKTCPFTDAQEAEKALKKAGAVVSLVTYAGGHGWHGDLYSRITEGVDWLEKSKAKPAKSATR